MRNQCGEIRMRKMKDSGIEWIGQIPEEWNIWPTKRFFRHTKTLAGEQVDSLLSVVKMIQKDYSAKSLIHIRFYVKMNWSSN